MTYRSRTRFFLEGLEGLAVLPSVVCSWPLSRWWLKHWGSTAQERERIWPGDALVLADHDTYTRAIGVAAPAEEVWKWAVQFGLNRAGFYSYELLERLVGIPVKNLESIDPAFQSLSVGDEVRLHPKAPGIPVASLRPDRHICFGVALDPDSLETRADPSRSWSLYLEPTSANSCRLLLRGCLEAVRKPSRLKTLALLLEAPIDFVMEQRMLRTIQRLAETG